MKIEKIWSEYHQRLLGFIKQRVTEKDAEDILQDVFVKIHSRLDSLKENTKIESWIYQITRNTIVDYYRSKRPSESIPDWLSQETKTEYEELNQELCSCFTPMIENLPDHYSRAIKLSEIAGKTQKEVAELEAISLSGAKSRIQRGRTILRAMLLDCCDLELSRTNSVLSCDPKVDSDCKNC